VATTYSSKSTCYLIKKSSREKTVNNFVTSMAKVTGPLMSMTASGKIADTIVFFSWKGISTVRQWLVPANPQSDDQGDIRLILGGLGRAVGKVGVDNAYHDKLKALDVIPAQQTKQSYLVQYIKNTFIAGKGATMTGNYNSVLAELTGHSAYTAFKAGADTLNLTDFDIAYATIDPFEKALGVYLLAKAAIALGFTGSPYTKTLADWTGAQVDKLVNHLTS